MKRMIVVVVLLAGSTTHAQNYNSAATPAYEACMSRHDWKFDHASKSPVAMHQDQLIQ
jgi:hypothetical protein